MAFVVLVVAVPEQGVGAGGAGDGDAGGRRIEVWRCGIAVVTARAVASF